MLKNHHSSLSNSIQEYQDDLNFVSRRQTPLKYIYPCDVDSIVSRSLLEAARYGAYELVEIIVRRFPSLAYCYDRDQKNIFHIALENRCENVFNLVYQLSQHLHQLMMSIDI